MVDLAKLLIITGIGKVKGKRLFAFGLIYWVIWVIGYWVLSCYVSVDRFEGWELVYWIGYCCFYYLKPCFLILL